MQLCVTLNEKRPKGRWKIYDESHISKKRRRKGTNDKIWYDMALCIIISWETSPPLALGPWQDRSFQLKVGGLKPFAFWWRSNKWLLTTYHIFLTYYHICLIFFDGIFKTKFGRFFFQLLFQPFCTFLTSSEEKK